MQHKYVLCSVQCSMCIMKCKGADSGASSGSGAVHTVLCAVGSVQGSACNRQRVSTLNQISLIKFYFLTLGFQKRIALVFFFKTD